MDDKDIAHLRLREERGDFSTPMQAHKLLVEMLVGKTIIAPYGPLYGTPLEVTDVTRQNIVATVHMLGVESRVVFPISDVAPDLLPLALSER